jgi:hypothetical protein
MVLEKETVRTMDIIEVGKVGAMGTDDPEADGYYLVKWIEEPYQGLQPLLSSQDMTHPSKFRLENGFVEAHTTTKLAEQNSGIYLRKSQ